MNLCSLLVGISFLLVTATANAEKITIAAAADLKYAMDEIVTDFNKIHPVDHVDVVYGSSGKFHAQIQQDAPYDLFFSADISFPRELARKGFAASDVTPYAVGRIVLWSVDMDAAKMTMNSLTDGKISRIAIANPKHAPYGKRAEEALRTSKLWDTLQSKLIFGENISQVAQYVKSGNAQVGIVALSLVLSAELAKKGGYYLIPENLHTPLEQGYIITRRGGKNSLARQFADYMGAKQARAVMTRYGFILPGERKGK